MRRTTVSISGGFCGLALAGTPSLPPHLVELLDCAATAPSSHNSQPWRVRVTSDSTFRLEADPERRLREVDPGDRETLLSLGAFWETLEQAAAALEWPVESSVVSAAGNPVPVGFVLRLGYAPSLPRSSLRRPVSAFAAPAVGR